MDLLRIALLQIAPCGSLEGNLKKGVEYCKKAKEMGAHIALLPEMWSCGYDICRRPFEEWKKEAVPADSSFVRTFGGLARELSMAIGITFLEKCGEGCRNTLVLYDWKGKRVLTYAKVHTCEFGAEADLMLKGAELILVPNACPMEINRLSRLRARAFENMTAICTCNYRVRCRTATAALLSLTEWPICRIFRDPETCAFSKPAQARRSVWLT